MTTPQADAEYFADHMREWYGKPYVIYNPLNFPVETLPAIYGFNNGGDPGFLYAVAIAADGTVLGSHICSSEGYMPYDLGCIDGARPDRHENHFRPHYPDGYRMEFVSERAVDSHVGLQAALTNNRAFRDAAAA